MQRNWVSRALALPRSVLAGSVAWMRTRYNGLKKRYGPRYTHALFIVTIIAFFSPLPGTTLAAIALVVLIAEIHRAVSRRRQNRQAIAQERALMSINCEIVVDRSATPEQLTALGSALWDWCGRTKKSAGIYQYLDSQVLTDLISGRLPSSGQSPEQSEQESDGIHFKVRDDESLDRQAAVAALRRDIPRRAVVDIVVAGISWNQERTRVFPCTTN